VLYGDPKSSPRFAGHGILSIRTGDESARRRAASNAWQKIDGQYRRRLRSAKPNSIRPNFCLECGWRGQMLRRHLNTGHGLNVDQYRVRWKLPRDHPITAPSYSERRSGVAKQLGLGRGRRVSPQESEPGATEAPTTPQRRSRRRGGSRSTGESTLGL
jgi:hypothetical protein